jgi:hypothetical protein
MRYYQLQRQQEASSSSFSGGGGGNAGGRVTVRALESSLRLAEAHAKLMFHRTVTIEVGVNGLNVSILSRYYCIVQLCGVLCCCVNIRCMMCYGGTGRGGGHQLHGAVVFAQQCRQWYDPT